MTKHAKPKSLTALGTAEEIVRKLGGPSQAARIGGCSRSGLVEALDAGHLPAKSYYPMLTELQARGYSAPPSIWRQADPPAAQIEG